MPERRMSRQRPAWCSGDVVVHHHHLVGAAEELLGEDADGGGAAAHAHAFFFHAVDDGRAARLDDDLRAAVDGEVHGLLVAQRFHHLHGHAAFLLAAAGQVVHATERQHLRAVFHRGDVADDLALAAHVGLLGAEEAVGVDLQLEAAVAEDAFGDDGDHVHVLHLGGDDEGRGLVVRVGGGTADAGDEDLVGMQQVAVPVGGGGGGGGGGRAGCAGCVRCVGRRRLHAAFECDQRRVASVQRAAQQQHRVDADQRAFVVGVAIAGAGLACADLAQHRAGVALDLVAGHAFVARARALQHLRQRGGVQARQSIGLRVLRHATIHACPARFIQCSIHYMN
jgi:hypothetical protein